MAALRPRGRSRRARSKLRKSRCARASCAMGSAFLSQSSDDAETTGNRRGEFGKTDIVHAALYDGMQDAKHFGKHGLYVHLQIRPRRNNIAPSFAQSSTLVIAVRCSDQ